MNIDRHFYSEVDNYGKDCGNLDVTGYLCCERKKLLDQ